MKNHLMRIAVRCLLYVLMPLSASLCHALTCEDLENTTEFHLLEDACEFHAFENLCEFHLLEDWCEFHAFENLCEFHLFEDLCEFHTFENLFEFHLLEDLNEFHIDQCPCKMCWIKQLCKLYWLFKCVKCQNKTPSSPLPKDPPVDLEATLCDFILETKQIQIPHHPEAYNPSIVQWNHTFLMCFRARRPLSRLPDQIGFIFLDESFDPVGEPTLLDLTWANPAVPSKPQDPRLITLGNKLLMIFSDKLTPFLRRMYVAEIHFDGTKFYTDEPVCLSEFENESQTRWEKNWVPFIYQDQLLLAYSIQPHQILRPFSNGTCTCVQTTSSPFLWSWGPLHGGTPAIFIDGQYLSFFQSHMNMASEQSHGKTMPHYFMGAYTFEAHPPFSITAASSQPIIGKNFYNGPACTTWKPMRVVFPTGLLEQAGSLWLFYGRQDNEIWRAKLDKTGLLSSLTPTN